MGEVAIRIDGLWKEYRIGQQDKGYRTFREAIADTVKSPFRRLGQAGKAIPQEEHFWALRDVSFTVAPGEVVGIIGRNGAGKSTLLKVLSRITAPTRGRLEVHGRIASLLEVGTGFHPELTGRENIFLNGAILGMRRAEIERKFDAIVAFAEIERFLDTPVKRYSSGMYVRLAFAVAAHLEPEILVVDEVLAVGDGRFQQKCLGKMEEVAKLDGRTVLLVSHNLAAVKSLATRAITLDRGALVSEGDVDTAIRAYAALQDEARETPGSRDWGRGTHTTITSVRLLDGAGGPTGSYIPGEPMRIEVELETDGTAGLSLEVFILDQIRDKVGLASTHQFHGESLPPRAGRFQFLLELAPVWLASGRYFLDVCTSVVNVGWDHHVDTAIEFDVPFSNPGGETWDFKQSYGYGQIALPLAAPATATALPR